MYYRNVNSILEYKTSVFMHSKEPTGVGESYGNKNVSVINLFIVKVIDKMYYRIYVLTTRTQTQTKTQT